MSAKFLDDAARAAFERAISTIEGKSAVEVVIAVRRTSSNYLHANVIVGVAIAFLAVAVALFIDHPFSLATILIDPFVIGLLFGASVQLLPWLKRWLTPRSIRKARVGTAAKAAFLDRGVHNTVDRSGLLVYISWLEQEIALVPDSGLAARVTEAIITEHESAMRAAMREGGAAVANQLANLAAACERAMPRSEADVNELPDHIDSDLHGAKR